nr:ATP-binding protein [Nocardia asiatica]
MREALSNTVRHSGAASVSVEITVADDLTIVVEDDGCGMPGEVTPSGLTNLARCAEDPARGSTSTTPYVHARDPC